MNKNQDDNRRSKKQEDRDLPGYPHYPPDEDIMNPQSGFKKIHADEELANSTKLSSRLVSEKQERDTAQDDRVIDDADQIKIVRGTEADVTKEDLDMLGRREGDPDLGDDELIMGKDRVDDVIQEVDLDVPGSDLDDKEEDLGEEDEENNYYSIGGDRHENLEEDQSFENEEDQ